MGRIIVANRSLERAQTLASTLGGYAIGLDDLPAHLPEADIVISSTGARGHILDREPVARALASAAARRC